MSFDDDLRALVETGRAEIDRDKLTRMEYADNGYWLPREVISALEATLSLLPYDPNLVSPLHVDNDVLAMLRQDLESGVDMQSFSADDSLRQTIAATVHILSLYKDLPDNQDQKAPYHEQLAFDIASLTEGIRYWGGSIPLWLGTLRALMPDLQLLSQDTNTLLSYLDQLYEQDDQMGEQSAATGIHLRSAISLTIDLVMPGEHDAKEELRDALFIAMLSFVDDDGDYVYVGNTPSPVPGIDDEQFTRLLTIALEHYRQRNT